VSRAAKRELREKILVGTDFSTAARQALIRARSLAREREALLFVLHVIDPSGLEEVCRLAEVPEKLLRERLQKDRRGRLQELLEEVEGGADAVGAEVVLAWGRPFEEILHKAAQLGVDLIVLGTAGRSADLERALFGSTAEKVLRAAPCPVLCVPAE
jgi:nucleotide-binding universal stress UspA family protein